MVLQIIKSEIRVDNAIGLLPVIVIILYLTKCDVKLSQCL